MSPNPHDTDTVIFEPSGERGWGFKCLHDHCANRTIKDVLKYFGVSAANSFPPPKGGDGEGTNFHPVTAADLLAQKPEPIVWVWEHFLPEGALNLLVAYMKVGKSTFTYAIAVAVARGAPFLDFPTKQGGGFSFWPSKSIPGTSSSGSTASAFVRRIRFTSMRRP